MVFDEVTKSKTVQEKKSIGLKMKPRGLRLKWQVEKELFNVQKQRGGRKAEKQ